MISFRYHAPERAQMNQCGRPEDIFALGCTYIEMLQRIFSRATLNPENHSAWSFQANLDEVRAWLLPFKSSEFTLRSAIAFLVERMLSYNPNDRPTIKDILAILRIPNWYCKGSYEWFGHCCYAGKKFIFETLNWTSLNNFLTLTRPR